MRTARRLGWALESTEEPLFHWRRQGTDGCEQFVRLREGIVNPISFQRGRDLPAGNVTFLSNPAFVLITPSTEMDSGEPMDMMQGDLLVRLRYQHGAARLPDEADSAYVERITPIAYKTIHQIFTVHSYEEQFNCLRILGDLQV